MTIFSIFDEIINNTDKYEKITAVDDCFVCFVQLLCF